MYVCIYIYLYYIYIYIYSYIYIYIYIYTYIYIHVYIVEGIQRDLRHTKYKVDIYTHTFICMYVPHQMVKK